MYKRQVITDVKGKKVAENTSDVRTGSDHASINFTVKSPELWTAETPTMYQATFTSVSYTHLVGSCKDSVLISMA